MKNIPPFAGQSFIDEESAFINTRLPGAQGAEIIAILSSNDEQATLPASVGQSLIDEESAFINANLKNQKEAEEDEAFRENVRKSGGIGREKVRSSTGHWYY